MDLNLVEESRKGNLERVKYLVKKENNENDINLAFVYACDDADDDIVVVVVVVVV